MTRRKKIVVAILFLVYLLCVWVGAFLWGEDLTIVIGLVLTACGATILVVYILVSRLSQASKPAAPEGQQQATPAPAPEPAGRDWPELKALLAEANQRLANSPTLASQHTKATLKDFPMYLLLGAEGSGKTSTFVNSGLEPELLAGQAHKDGNVVSTRLANIWFSKGVVMVEPSGRLFTGDPSDWTRLLAAIQPTERRSLFHLMFRPPAPKNFQGVVLFCDVGDFVGVPDASKQTAAAQRIQQRLRDIGARLGADFPVYVLLSKSDSIPYFREFFNRLTGSEETQVLGSSVPPIAPSARPASEVYNEAENKRLSEAFNQLYCTLAEHRLTFLGRETDAKAKPSVYEFPRELKRLRGSLIDWLVEIFRPNPLQPGPVLRGFYFTGVRQVPAGTETVRMKLVSGGAGSGEATRLLNVADMREEMQRAAAAAGEPERRDERTVPRWTFVTQLFNHVFAADRKPIAHLVDKRLDLYRKLAFGGLAALMLLFALLFAWSWWNNRALMNDVDAAAQEKKEVNPVVTLEVLQKQLQTLQEYEHHLPWRFGFLLYRGSDVLDPVRNLYFMRFQQYLLKDARARLENGIESAPVQKVDYDPAYDQLKAYLSITITRDCSPPEQPFLPDQLAAAWAASRHNAESPDVVDSARRQFAFYATELRSKKELPFVEKKRNDDMVAQGRSYLESFGGPKRLYRGIIDRVNRERGVRRVMDLSPRAPEIFDGQLEMPFAFTREGSKKVEEAIKGNKPQGNSCVLGTSASPFALLGSDSLQAELRNLYVGEYIAKWQAFLVESKVKHYRDKTDAVSKLGIMNGNDSPILGLLFFVRDNTNFPPAASPGGSSQTQKDVENRAKDGFYNKFGRGRDLAKLGAEIGQKKLDAGAEQPKRTEAEIRGAFESVQKVFDPQSSSRQYVDKTNGPYLETIHGFQTTMSNLIDSDKDAQLNAQAKAAAEKGIDAVGSISRAFMVPDEAGDQVARIMKSPFDAADGLYVKDRVAAAVKDLKGGLGGVCGKLGQLLKKIPFNPGAKDDASLGEVGNVFSLKDGSLWAFYDKDLKKTIELGRGGLYVQKADAPDPKVSDGFLRWFNRMAAISTALFSDQGSEAHMRFKMKILKDSNPKRTVSLKMGGETVQQGVLHEYNWPGPNDELTLDLKFTDNHNSPTFGYPWGIFKLLEHSDKIAPNRFALRNTSTEGSKPAPLLDGNDQPEPVEFEVSEFPGKVDAAFNKDFFTGLTCPAKVTE